ncbi:MAG: LysE family transporter [Candidatus Delongbacteria bacterium]|jgi:threonine/homoserine/homoserine lactone efflux protein|nr:LysE family transporter [Candidatus Delongbacteria bacterium]
MIDFLIAGIILGLSAGVAPGPLLTLVISETIQHNIKAGVKVALAPLVTDLPIVLLTFFIISKLSSFNLILGIISLCGALFLLYMGYENIRTKNINTDFENVTSRSLTKGIIANTLSPHPYLFWLSVGSPMIIRAMKINTYSVISFISGFYIFLLGSKIVIAILVGRSKTFLNDKIYLYTIRFLGSILWIFAIVLFYDGIKLFGII